MKMRFYLLIIIAATLTSCSKTVTVKTKYETGTPMEEYQVLKSDSEIKHGLYKRYNKEEQVVEKASYENGKLNGTRILYYPNGNTEIIETYLMDNFDGEYKSYYESGNISSKGLYKNNYMVEPWQYYYDLPGEKIKEIINYEENIENGPYKEFYENGNVMAEGVYKDELDNGPFKSYYENGELEMEGTYLNGRKNGIFKMYDEDGNFIEEKTYENGILK